MKREDALDYHASGRPGKIAVVPTKPLNNQRDLALAYSPGVALPCLKIKANPDDAYLYTARGNLVAVVTNGTAVLGLGNIGALAGKPVMEGKANLFKQFADLDVFDLEVGSENPDDVIRFCQLLEPTVGGINLEDIRAPDCFYIEETLRKTMKIPVFHDDQHGTAIISGAALLNALEILPDQVRAVRSDAIIATGRSDYPNQVNNVLGFPFIFRGALDARATQVNEDMKMAATRALAALAKEDVPESVSRLYGLRSVKFGPDYLIPFPFDPRVLLWVAPAVAWAAVASGVAKEMIDLEQYREQLELRLGRARGIMRGIINRAVRDPKRIVFPEGEEPKIIRAARMIVDEGIGSPVLLGQRGTIERIAEENHISLRDILIDDPATSNRRDKHADYLWQRRQRKGLSHGEAHQLLFNGNYFGSVMVACGDADALLSGVGMHYPETIRPALQVIGAHPKAEIVSGLYMLVFEKHVVFCGDRTVNIEPTAEQLTEIAYSAGRLVRTFGITPKIAMLSFSNFGSVRHPEAEKVATAVAILRKRDPALVVDGEMQADTAMDENILRSAYPFSILKERANVLIFPNLSAGNIAYKLLHHLGGATTIGPILLGMNLPVHVLEQGADVQDIVNMAAVAVIDAQQRISERKSP